MASLENKNILVNVTGSISAYKACALISLLMKQKCNVKVIATEDALKFVGRASFEGLCHNKVLTSMFDNDDAIAHITLSQKWADLIISYPSSANTINRLAAGLSDDLFGAVCLANNFNKPLLIAPAMNTQMYLHPAVQSSLEKLKSWGAQILPCGEGELACGVTGVGRLLEPSEALDCIAKALNCESVEAKK